jgi:DNA-binding transcriptional LysR family regulator
MPKPNSVPKPKSASNPAWDWDSRIGRRIRLRDLHVLSAVVRWGSMAKAASHLAMSQSVVSEAVANLEDALQVRLLDRRPHGIEPTVYAAALLKRGTVVFDELREAIKDIELLSDATHGEVRIACPEILSAGLLAGVVERFTQRHPQAVVRLSDANVASLEFRQLQERNVDLVVTRVPSGFADDDLDVEILFDDPHVAVAGVASRWVRRRRLTLADLAGEPWILPPSPVVLDVFEEAFAAEGLDAPAARISTSSILMRSRLLATGRFLTVLPRSVLRYTAKPWPVRALPVELKAAPRPIAIVTLKDRTISPAVQLFVEELRAAAKAFAPRGGI